jgi:glycosyltransferase involved in cell wall biosynthesis
MTNPAISVIIPSFNRPQLTARAVKSVLAQTWSDFEILVIDDGSDPDQVFSTETFADGRVRLIRYATNLGVSAARNRGVYEARAPLVAFLDSDDCWLPDKLASQTTSYKEWSTNGNVLVYSSYYREQSNVRCLCPLTPWKRGQALSDFLFLDYGSVHTSTWLGQRTLFQQFPFDTQLVQCEDFDLLLRMEAAGVQFVWCKSPAAVRNCDLREDRLSTRLNKTFYSKFLDQNSGRLTPMSYVALESVVLNSSESRSLMERLQKHIRHFLKSSQLSWVTRVRLVATYLFRRCVAKVKLRLNMRHSAYVTDQWNDLR